MNLPEAFDRLRDAVHDLLCGCHYDLAGDDAEIIDLERENETLRTALAHEVAENSELRMWLWGGSCHPSQWREQ